MKTVLDLNAKVIGKEAKSFEPLPAGSYDVVVVEVGEWKNRDFDNVDINLKDEAGNLVRNAQGKIEKIKASFTAYSADVKLKVISGDYEGRFIFTNITTHPDVTFLLDQFIYATVNECVLSDLQKLAVDKNVRVVVGIKEYPRIFIDPNTAIETTEIRTKNFVKSFSKLKIENDYGI